MRLDSGWGFPAPPSRAPIPGKGRKIYKNRYNWEVSGALLGALPLPAAGRAGGGESSGLQLRLRLRESGRELVNTLMLPACGASPRRDGEEGGGGRAGMQQGGRDGGERREGWREAPPG